ncbi:unnamed protein product, partial [Gongylonema pulchrum]|uniref:CwfJ_C_1 domain-containing protein n=1 Tax=Gongylonema pulchrum TaxID=637853 RepID=A0A183DRX6_9BILA
MVRQQVLVCGDVNGQFKALVKRVNEVNDKHGPFVMLFCVGEFFGTDDETNRKIISGDITMPLPTYILGPCSPSTSRYYPEAGCDFSGNLTFLGKKGILNTADGLQVAYLSGVEGPQSSSFQFVRDDIKDLLNIVTARSGFLGFDLLLTGMWPAEVSKFSTNYPKRETAGSPLISQLAAALKPQYHFAGMGVHYERTPYRNHRILQEQSQHATRFIGLASVKNSEKEKWLYAFSIEPIRQMTVAERTKQPEHTTECPYLGILERLILENHRILQEQSQHATRFIGLASVKNSEKEKWLYAFSIEPIRQMTVAERTKQPEHTTECPYLGILERLILELREMKRKQESSAEKEQYFFDMSSSAEDLVDHGGKRPRKSDRTPREQQPCWFCLSNVDAEQYLV